jgi:hypothetical protein
MAGSVITEVEIATTKEQMHALTRPITTRHLILRGDSNVTDKEFDKLLAGSYITQLTIIGNDALTDEGFVSAMSGVKGLEKLHLERVHGVTQNGLIKALKQMPIKLLHIDCCDKMRSKDDIDSRELEQNIFKKELNGNNEDKSQEFRFTIRYNENEYSSSKAYQGVKSTEENSRSSQTSLFKNFANEKSSQNNFQPLFQGMMENILARTLDRALDRTIDNTLDRAFANRVSRQQFVDRMMENLLARTDEKSASSVAKQQLFVDRIMENLLARTMENLLSRAAEKPANGFSRQQSTPNR